MRKAYWFIAIAYLVSGIAAAIVLFLAKDWHPILVVAVADLVGTIVIFGFSVYYDNLRVYDVYWSLAPILIVICWLSHGRTSILDNQLRQTIVSALLLCWVVRLILNWAIRWRGLNHEDWHYVQFREINGKTY